MWYSVEPDYIEFTAMTCFVCFSIRINASAAKMFRHMLRRSAQSQPRPPCVSQWIDVVGKAQRRIFFNYLFCALFHIRRATTSVCGSCDRNQLYTNWASGSRVSIKLHILDVKQSGCTISRDLFRVFHSEYHRYSPALLSLSLSAPHRNRSSLN